MLGAVQNIQSIGSIQITNRRNHLTIQVKRRRILVMVVISHGWMTFCAVKTQSLTHNRIAVPSVIAHAHQRSALQCLQRITPTHPVAIIEQSHTIHENSNIPSRSIRGGSSIFHWLQRYLKNRILRRCQARIPIQKRPRDIRRNPIGGNINPIRRILNLLNIRQNRIIHRG